MQNNMQNDMQNKYAKWYAIKINNMKLAEKLFENDTSKAIIVINNYSIAERQSVTNVDLVKVADCE